MGDLSQILSHPVQDKTLDGESQEYARKMLSLTLALHTKAEETVEAHFLELGVPLEIVRRVLIHAAKHRIAMLSAHHLAIAGTDNAAADDLVTELAGDLQKLILEQLPNSRKSLEKAKEPAQ